MNNILYVNRSI